MTLDPKLYTRCRDARRAGAFTKELMAELMDACGRPALAAVWRDPKADAIVPMKLTGLEYFIKEAKLHQERLAKVPEA